jgi:hypothetical protein
MRRQDKWKEDKGREWKRERLNRGEVIDVCRMTMDEVIQYGDHADERMSMTCDRAELERVAVA